MISKIFVVLVLAFILGGCILQSQDPNFSEAQGSLLLGKNGGTYLPYVKENGAWKADGDGIAFSALGHSYTFPNKEKIGHVLFIPLFKSWSIAQFREGENNSVYVLVDQQPDAFYVHPLSCNALKRIAHSDKVLAYKKDDCFLKPQTKIQDFMLLIDAAGSRLSKWILKK
jgi:hypothetical protein